MRPLTFILAIPVLLGLSLWVVYPETPEVKGIPNYDRYHCLHNVAEEYDPEFFLYKSYFKVWYAHWTSKIGLWKLSPNLHDFYRRYVNLEIDVECHIIDANDDSLNMALSPFTFKAVYNYIAEQHDLRLIAER